MSEDFVLALEKLHNFVVAFEIEWGRFCFNKQVLGFFFAVTLHSKTDMSPWGDTPKPTLNPP